MLKELQEFGLSKNEARVYFASLEIGKATADEISKHAVVKRPTTYVQIQSLMQKGLMSSIEEGKKTFFSAESPEYLKRIVGTQKLETERKEKELEKLLPNLLQMHGAAEGRPRVRFFEGKEGLITMREEILKMKEGELLVMYSHDALSQVFTEAERDSYSQKRAEKNIKLKVIYSYTKGPFSGDSPFPNTSRKFISSDRLTLKTDIAIYDNKIALTALGEKLFGTIIESDDIAQSMRSIFKLMWENLK